MASVSGRDTGRVRNAEVGSSILPASNLRSLAAATARATVGKPDEGCQPSLSINSEPVQHHRHAFRRLKVRCGTTLFANSLCFVETQVVAVLLSRVWSGQ